MTCMKSRLLVASILMAIAFGSAEAMAQQIECDGPVGQVRAVTNPNGHQITTRYQFDTPNLQTLLSTTIDVGGGRPSCLVAHLSGSATIRDNYIVFQVRVDGVPMEGHLGSFVGVVTPVVWVGIDNVQDEQLGDPTKVASYNFFAQVSPGLHTIEVLAAAGSSIDFTSPLPSVNALVLTLKYR